VVAVVVAVLVLVFGVGQLVLPSIAEKVAREKIERYGKVQSVSIEAVPAIQLAWKSAQSVSVNVSHIEVTPKQATDLLHESKPFAKVDGVLQLLIIKAQAAGLTVPLPLRDVHVHKRQEEIVAEGQLLESDLRSALPGGAKVQLVPTADERVVMNVESGFFSGKVEVAAKNGALVLAPAESNESLPLFSDPRIDIESVHARSGPGGETVAVRARLR